MVVRTPRLVAKEASMDWSAALVACKVGYPGTLCGAVEQCPQRPRSEAFLKACL